MTKLPLRMAALVACLSSGVAAHAVPLTYDFAGIGSVCTFASNASCASTYEGAFTGSITIDILANGPGGPDSFTNGSTLAYDYDGWLQSDFLIQWDGNSFNPGPVDSQIASDNYVQLVNGYIGAEQLFNREAYRGFDGSTNFYASAGLTRQSSDPAWLTDLTFPEGLGLAPGPGAFNQLNFAEYTQTETGVYAGFSGMANLSSFTVRASSVPEPGTLVLFGLGLIGLGLCQCARTSMKASPRSRPQTRSCAADKLATPRSNPGVVGLFA